MVKTVVAPNCSSKKINPKFTDFWTKISLYCCNSQSLSKYWSSVVYWTRETANCRITKVFVIIHFVVYLSNYNSWVDWSYIFQKNGFLLLAKLLFQHFHESVLVLIKQSSLCITRISKFRRNSWGKPNLSTLRFETKKHNDRSIWTCFCLLRKDRRFFQIVSHKPWNYWGNR